MTWGAAATYACCIEFTGFITREEFLHFFNPWIQRVQLKKLFDTRHSICWIASKDTKHAFRPAQFERLPVKVEVAGFSDPFCLFQHRMIFLGCSEQAGIF